MTKERYAKIVQLAEQRDFDFAPDLREALRELLAELERYDVLKTAAKEILGTWAANRQPRLRLVWVNEAGCAQFDRLEAALNRLEV